MKNTWGLLQTQEKLTGMKESGVTGDDERSKMSMSC